MKLSSDTVSLIVMTDANSDKDINGNIDVTRRQYHRNTSQANL